MQPATFTSQQCNVVCGVTGQAHGQVIYGMSLTTADKIASAMLGQPIKTFDQLAASAIAELGNMISGNAMSKLSESGYISDITPPTIIRGTNVKISTLSIPAVVIPLDTAQGELFITVGLQGKKYVLAVYTRSDVSEQTERHSNGVRRVYELVPQSQDRPASWRSASASACCWQPPSAASPSPAWRT